MYGIVVASRANKALRRHARSGIFPVEKFGIAMHHLRSGEPIPLSYQDHTLKGALSGYREFHLAADLLVQYKRNEKNRVITISKIGSHTELFGE